MRRSGKLILFVCMTLVGLTVPSVAGHFAANGWWDRHYNYPPRPVGRTEIVNTFGQPCAEVPNGPVNYNRIRWVAKDNGKAYRLNFHKKLGGAAVPGWYKGNGGGSTNLYPDVNGHHGNEHIGLKSSIWGYLCKDIAGQPGVKSTHAWGISFDSNTTYEHFGSNCHNHEHSFGQRVKEILWGHNWYFGVNFCDPVHWQYATGY